ncbi:hypothetical protein Y032_0093g2661 [Ancylostoma ceylanicum]|uniref:Uncharacterized protein n=1 Tax=Ancylostoma ceylanicum TaxID=53326 RepID=A0A016TLQ9_9BILA|nr:hypothetical protein Y032_0093g2661 [Ancylostoma ceylanicum]
MESRHNDETDEVSAQTGQLTLTHNQMGRVLRAERGGRRAGTSAAQGTREMAGEHCPGSADRGGRGSGGGSSSTHGAGGGQTLARNRRLPGDAEMVCIPGRCIFNRNAWKCCLWYAAHMNGQPERRPTSLGFASIVVVLCSATQSD